MCAIFCRAMPDLARHEFFPSEDLVSCNGREQCCYNSMWAGRCLLYEATPFGIMTLVLVTSSSCPIYLHIGATASNSE
eukprot:4203432-Pyramimonas_sp.AAC.1